mmetsp:Transcript_81721/g.207639  ORF Transcript_81721/g.207639 Transcript_81721/m.207639 type:complete len:225 (+) Transcript_81721:275-949(+)
MNRHRNPQTSVPVPWAALGGTPRARREETSPRTTTSVKGRRAAESAARASTKEATIKAERRDPRVENLARRTMITTEAAIRGPRVARARRRRTRTTTEGTPARAANTAAGVMPARAAKTAAKTAAARTAARREVPRTSPTSAAGRAARARAKRARAKRAVARRRTTTTTTKTMRARRRCPRQRRGRLVVLAPSRASTCRTKSSEIWTCQMRPKELSPRALGTNS